MHSALAQYIEARTTEFGLVETDRRLRLDAIASYVRSKVRQQRAASLLFLGRHNSRRSHLAQVWAQTVAAWCEVGVVISYSAGVQPTRLAPAAVDALRRAGFVVDLGQDPSTAKVSFRADAPPMICYAKDYEALQVPQRNWCAVSVDAGVAAGFPALDEAEERVVLPLEDPDDDALCARVARDLLYAFTQVPVRSEED